MKILDLGCGDNKVEGAIGLDNIALSEVDIVHSISLKFRLLRRRAAPALLIQKPEFQTISVSVCAMSTKKRANYRSLVRLVK